MSSPPILRPDIESLYNVRLTVRCRQLDCFDEGENVWKDRGKGDLKILESKDTSGDFIIFMRRDADAASETLLPSSFNAMSPPSSSSAMFASLSSSSAPPPPASGANPWSAAGPSFVSASKWNAGKNSSSSNNTNNNNQIQNQSSNFGGGGQNDDDDNANAGKYRGGFSWSSTPAGTGGFGGGFGGGGGGTAVSWNTGRGSWIDETKTTTTPTTGGGGGGGDNANNNSDTTRSEEDAENDTTAENATTTTTTTNNNDNNEEDDETKNDDTTIMSADEMQRVVSPQWGAGAGAASEETRKTTTSSSSSTSSKVAMKSGAIVACHSVVNNLNLTEQAHPQYLERVLCEWESTADCSGYQNDQERKKNKNAQVKNENENEDDEENRLVPERFRARLDEDDAELFREALLTRSFPLQASNSSAATCEAGNDDQSETPMKTTTRTASSSSLSPSASSSSLRKDIYEDPEQLRDAFECEISSEEYDTLVQHRKNLRQVLKSNLDHLAESDDSYRLSSNSLDAMERAARSEPGMLKNYKNWHLISELTRRADLKEWSDRFQREFGMMWTMRDLEVRRDPYGDEYDSTSYDAMRFWRKSRDWILSNAGGKFADHARRAGRNKRGQQQQDREGGGNVDGNDNETTAGAGAASGGGGGGGGAGDVVDAGESRVELLTDEDDTEPEQQSQTQQPENAAESTPAAPVTAALSPVAAAPAAAAAAAAAAVDNDESVNDVQEQEEDEEWEDFEEEEDEQVPDLETNDN